jgi:hypothetical protein
MSLIVEVEILFDMIGGLELGTLGGCECKHIAIAYG